MVTVWGPFHLWETFIRVRCFNWPIISTRPFGSLIPREIIERTPTAELRKNHEDSQSLPLYENLDPMLEGILSYSMSEADLLNLGFEKKDVDLVSHLYHLSEYKRKQFCPIIKVRPKSFGPGHRVPICKSVNSMAKDS